MKEQKETPVKKDEEKAAETVSNKKAPSIHKRKGAADIKRHTIKVI